MTLVGRTLDAQYLVESHIKDGGMGAIYRARDLKLGNRYVAIKTLKPLVGNTEDAARLLREALLLSSVIHPAIVTFYGYGELPESKEPFLVLEFLEGRTLKEVVGERRLTTPLAASIMLQVAKGASALHRSGMRHRDLTPSNVMVLPDGSAKVIDLGIAKAFTEKTGEQVDLTKANQILGTPGYIAPEYLRGDAVDHRADLFAIGGMLYYSTSGTSVDTQNRPLMDT